MRLQVFVYTLLLACLSQAANAQTVDPFYAANYTITNLGSISGIPSKYGGMTFKDANTLWVSGNGASATGRFYSVPVTRGAGNHIVSLGSGTMLGFGSNGDGGAAFGPGGVFFFTKWPLNEIGEVLPPYTGEYKALDLNALGVGTSVGALNFVPPGYNGAGQFKVDSIGTNGFYTVTLTPDGSGGYNLGTATLATTLSTCIASCGAEAFVYVPLGSPQFSSQSMLVAEYGTGTVGSYPVDANGNPIPASRRNFINGLTNAQLAAIDPVTGDILLATFGSPNQVIEVTGFAAPLVTTTLPHVADGNGFDTLVLLINTGTSDATYSLQFFNQSGAGVNYQLDPSQSGMSGVIHAGSQAMVRTDGSGNSTNLGWGHLTAPASVKGMLIYQQQASPISLQEGSAPFIAPSEHFFVPFDNTAGSTTSIGFVNPSATQAANVNFTVRYASGGTDIVPALNMNPLQQLAETVTSLWGATAGQRGMIEVTANTPIGLVAFRFQGAALTLFDTIAPTAGGSTPITSSIAHAADGNNFRSTFLLTNSGTVDANYTLSILNAAGQPQTFNFDVANPLAGTVPAGSTLTIDTNGLGNVTNLGWAQLSAAPAVSGIEVFRQTNPGKSEQQATVPISQTNLSHFFLPFDNGANTTSIALANPDPAVAATINVTFRYVDGSSNAGQLMLSPRNYNANLLSSLFSATTGKAGVAEFTSNVPIAVVEVRFNPTQAFTSLRAVGP